MAMKKIKNPYKGLEEQGYNCFACCPSNPFGLKMEFYEADDKVVCRWSPRAEYQGWIDTLHGGVQAVLLDEICAWAVMRQVQRTGVTSKMETQYKRPISTNDEYIDIEAKVVEQRRNLVTVEAAIYNKEGELCTRAQCLYFTFPPEKAREEMGFVSCELEENE